MGKQFILLRLFGLLLAAVSLYQWLQGGLVAPIEYHGITVILPVHIALFLIGALLLIFPILPFTIFVALAPESLTGWARKILNSYEPLVSPVSAQHTSSGNLADRLDQFVKYSNRRFWLTTLATILFLTLVAPFLVTDQIAKSAFRLHGDGLLRLLRDTRFDFSSADSFRQGIQDADPALNSFESTATHKIHSILSQLYNPSVTSTASFERQLAAIYDAKIQPYVLADLGVLDLASLPIPYDPAIESSSAKATLLTLLANICNEQGNQGRYVDPYLQGRQLLKEALRIKVRNSQDLAYTHNVLGVNYADSLRCYTKYRDKFSSKQEAAQRIRSVLSENQPLSQLTIARLADYHYRQAVEASPKNFARARYLNNSADLRIGLLREAHLQGIAIDGRGTTDEQFLSQNVDPPVPGDLGWRPTRLVSILRDLEADLNQAIDLAHAPRIYFTRAQLYSLGGDLNEKYRLQSRGPWSSAAKLRELGLQDLRTAASLGLPARFFEASRATEFGVGWIWKAEELRPILMNLATSPTVGN